MQKWQEIKKLLWIAHHPLKTPAHHNFGSRDNFSLRSVTHCWNGTPCERHPPFIGANLWTRERQAPFPQQQVRIVRSEFKG
jgi:hypothetical protein